MFSVLSGWISDHSAAAAHRRGWHFKLQFPGREEKEPSRQENSQYQTDPAGAGQRQKSPR